MPRSLITSPASEPVSLAEARKHLRVDSGDEDGLIASEITAAREYCETFQGRAYVTQTWECYLDGWPAEDFIRIPLPPLQSVASVTYKDADGNVSTLVAGTDYIVDTKAHPGRVVLAYGKSWPSATLYPVNPITIRFTAGYGDAADDVPQKMRQAMLLLIGHMHENREPVLIGSISKELEFTLSALLWQDRVFMS